MNTYLHIVIQFSDMSEPENNCSVLTVAIKCEVCGCFDVSQSNVSFTLLLQPPEKSVKLFSFSN